MEDPVKKGTKPVQPTKDDPHWAAYGISGAIGVVSARSAIKEAVHDQFKDKYESLITLNKQRDLDQAAAAANPVFRNVRHGVAKETARLQGVYADKFRDSLKNDHKISGMVDYVISLTPTNRIKVMGKAFTVAGVALGVLLTAANMKHTTKLFSNQEQQNQTER